jgi:integrase
MNSNFGLIDPLERRGPRQGAEARPAGGAGDARFRRVDGGGGDRRRGYGRRRMSDDAAEEVGGGGGQELEQFLRYVAHERQLSPQTVRAYTDDLAEFRAFLDRYYGAPEWTWAGVDRLAIRSFMGDCATRRGLARSSIARKLSAVRSFYRFLHVEGHVEANPARAVRTPSASAPSRAS